MICKDKKLSKIQLLIFKSLATTSELFILAESNLLELAK